MRFSANCPSKAQLTPIAKVEPRSLPAPIVVEKDFPLATAIFGLPSLPVNHPDYAALKVLNHVIGSGDFDSRLMDEIRVKRGLAYAIQTRLENDSVTSLVLGAFATKNENMGPALGVINDVLAAYGARGADAGGVRERQAISYGFFSAGFRYQRQGRELLVEHLARRRGAGSAGLPRAEDQERLPCRTSNAWPREVLKADQLIVTVVGKPAAP